MTDKRADIAEVWSTWPAQIVWYRSPYRTWVEPEDDEDSGHYVAEPEVLVEITALNPAVEWPLVPPWHDLGGVQGSVACDNVAEALAEAPLLQLEHGLIIWRGVVAVCLPQDRSPREWHRIEHPVPGQAWPEDAIDLGGCLECGATGACPSCAGAEMSPDDLCDHLCICHHTGKCCICEGTRLLPSPWRLIEAMSDRDASEREFEEIEQEREENKRQRRAKIAE